MKKQFLLVIFVALLLCLQENSFAQRKPKPKDALVFEISKSSSPGGGGMGRRFHTSSTFYFYQSGRIDCQSIRYDERQKEIKSVKSKCIQINKVLINELVELAELADFLEAKDSYIFFSGGGVDYGNKSFSIRYYRKTGEKEISLTTRSSFSNGGPIPQSVTTFLQKIGEIDEAMRVKYEFRDTSDILQ